MLRDLYHFNRAAERIESIANSLSEITRTNFDAPAATRDAEQRFSHMIDPRHRNPETERMLGQEVERVRKETEKVLEAQAYALVQQLPVAEKTVADTFEAVRPQRDVSNATAVLLSQERWASARALLESGRSLPEVVSLADLPTLFAIEAFAADYLYAQSKPSTLGDPGIDLAAVRRSVDVRVRARLAELVEEDDRAVLESVHRAQGFTDIAWEYARHLERRFRGASSSGLEVAIAVGYIRREYGIDPKPAEARRKANAAVATEASARLNRLNMWAERIQTA